MLAREEDEKNYPKKIIATKEIREDPETWLALSLLLDEIP
jgi:hypothetical protein